MKNIDYLWRDTNKRLSAVDELESAIHELDHLLRWINE